MTLVVAPSSVSAGIATADTYVGCGGSEPDTKTNENEERAYGPKNRYAPSS